MGQKPLSVKNSECEEVPWNSFRGLQAREKFSDLKDNNKKGRKYKRREQRKGHGRVSLSCTILNPGPRVVKRGG